MRWPHSGSLPRHASESNAEDARGGKHAQASHIRIRHQFHEIKTNDLRPLRNAMRTTTDTMQGCGSRRGIIGPSVAYYSVCSMAAGIFATDIKDRATWLSNWSAFSSSASDFDRRLTMALWRSCWARLRAVV
jgi:hypothetical protein